MYTYVYSYVRARDKNSDKTGDSISNVGGQAGRRLEWATTATVLLACCSLLLGSRFSHQPWYAHISSYTSQMKYCGTACGRWCVDS